MPPLGTKDDDCRLSEVASLEDCFLAEETEVIDSMNKEAEKTGYKYNGHIVWKVVAMMSILHVAGIYGAVIGATSAMYKTWIYVIIVAHYATLSITAGSHRLWTHKAYKASKYSGWKHYSYLVMQANYGVRMLWMIGSTIAAQGHVIWWSRQHRCHHKWTDSDADPHNSKRGWFFSHMGWLMVKRHPKTLEMGAKIDLSDLEADELLVFQSTYLWPFALFLYYVISFIPWYFWDEELIVSFFFVGAFRLMVQYNMTWTINSVAHLWGYHKPFDKEASACDNLWHSSISNGEAWHNFHHAFPQDYRASEFAWKANLTGMIIDFFAWNGWVWDRKIMCQEAVERQKEKFGDHSRQILEFVKAN